MDEKPIPKPEDILNDILKGLQSEDATQRSDAIRQLTSLNYSSEAVRNELEKLAANGNSEALTALDTPAQRNVRRHFNRVDKPSRRALLQEIEEWEKFGWLDSPKADLLRRRYDFDLTPVSKSPPDLSETEGKVSASKPDPAEPHPALAQTLLSEANIKIALYLGAFFVVASAAILGAFVDVFRIPLLIIGTLFFGGASVAIKKRLPQPSFALFIVFSFFLPITANVIENTLELTGAINASYWVFVGMFMTVVWSGGTWLYTSRLFSLTALAAFATAFHRVGDLFNAQPEFSAAMLGFAALAGLAGVWVLKKWQDRKFALPLFVAAQLLELGLLAFYQGSFMFNTGDFYASELWNLLLALTWMLAVLFYILSNMLYPFLLFPWLAAGSLAFIPWAVADAFEASNLANALVFAVWGFGLSITSEISNKFMTIRKYSLPVLLTSIPVFSAALISGYAESDPLGFSVALFITLVYGVLHFLRPRGWLWTLALLYFVIAYISFFALPFVEKADIPVIYRQLGLALLLLSLEIFLKKASRAWSLPPKWLGSVFTLITAITLLSEISSRAAIGYAIFTGFFIGYAAIQRKATYGYLPAAFLTLTVFFTLRYFDLDLWLPALTFSAALYFTIGAMLKGSWARMLRNSGLILGVVVALGSLITTKETGGWYALIVGLLFAVEMALGKNGWIEAGLPALFSVGAFLILRDLNQDQISHHLLAYSFVWLIPDLIAHLAFKYPRPLKWIIRGMGAILALVNYGVLFFDGSAATGTLGFGLYALLFLTLSLVYRQPNLFYTFTLTMPLFVTFAFRSFDIVKWIHPVIFLAMGYYTTGFLLRLLKRAVNWDLTLLFSGLGLGVAVSVAAPVLGGLDAALPVAFAATFWAVEAFWRKNVWLGFPANGLYLLAYFIILIELNVDQPQFYSMGAALLGIIQHYLLTRAESKTGTFVMGMLSQLTLLGTTYIQMVSNGSEGLIYFVVLFLQSLAVLVYGVIIRSRSLTFTPIFFSVIGVLSVLYIVAYDLLDAFTTILMVGCTGVILIALGILAVLMRERLTKFGEKLSEWKA